MRTGFQNREGVVYNPDDLKTLFAQDMQAVADFINNYVPPNLSPYYKIDGSNGPLTNLETSQNGKVRVNASVGNYAEWLIENTQPGVTDGARLRLKNGNNIWDIQSEGDNVSGGNDYGLNIIHNGTVVAKFRYSGGALEIVGALSASNLGGTNTGDETTSTIKTKLGISTLSGSNTGDQVGDGSTITGRGTVADPFVAHTSQGHTLETKTDNYSIALTDKEKTLVMNASTLKTFTLPSVDGSNVGVRYTLVKVNTGRLNIQTSDSDVIADSGAGQMIYNSQTNETYATITLELVTATLWAITGACGTWVTTQ